MSIYDNKIYFADKEIVIGQDETIAINFYEPTGETIKSKMKNYGK